MKYRDYEIGLMQAKHKMKRPEMITVRCDTQDTISIEIGASCTLRLSEDEVDELRRLLFSASDSANALRRYKNASNSDQNIVEGGQ